MNTGVSLRTARPTTAGIDNTAPRISDASASAHSWNDGMLMAIAGPNGKSGSQRRRSSASSTCDDASTGTFSAAIVCLPRRRRLETVAGLETAHRRNQLARVAIVGGPRRRSGEVAEQHEPVVQRARAGPRVAFDDLPARHRGLGQLRRWLTRSVRYHVSNAFRRA
jgi:hypothetical protein